MFHYVQNRLYCENVPVDVIAAAVGTPAYVYSAAALVERARAFTSTAADILDRYLICFALKANNNLALLRLLASKGLGADVTSGGELFIALRAGFSPDKIVFSGVGKTDDEIETAITAEILALHVESAMEMEAVAQIARRRQKIVRVAVRINPDIAVDTHPHISTGAAIHKFGVAPEEARSLMLDALASPWLNPIGLGVHIGSQITDLEPFRQAALFLAALATDLRRSGLPLSYLDMGGGLGIDYLGQGVPVPGDLVRTVAPVAAASGFGLVMEPGRSICGPAGILVSRVTYLKEQEGKRRFIILDAGMNDLIRPALYDAHHPIWPLLRPPNHDEGSLDIDQFDVVGPVCETTDTFAAARELPVPRQGDLIAIMQAGAYGFAMSSSYNGRPRLAEVLVDGDRWNVVRRRQTYEDLVADCM